MDKKASSRVVHAVFDCVMGIAGMFRPRSPYGKARDDAKAYCNGDSARWESLKVEIKKLWTVSNPTPLASDLKNFNSAVSYFRDQIGIKPRTTGNGSPKRKGSKALEKQAEADAKHDAEQSAPVQSTPSIMDTAKPTSQVQRIQIAKLIIGKLADICGCSMGDAFRLIDVVRKEMKIRM